MFSNPVFSEAEPIVAGMAGDAIFHGFPSHLEEARHYLTGLMKFEVGAAGGVEPALRSIATETHVGFETLKNIRRPDRLKSAKPSVAARLKAAYLNMCSRQIAALQHQITIAQEAHRDVCFDDLAAEISDLAARVADAQQGSLGERVHRGLRSRLDRRGVPSRLISSNINLASDARVTSRATPTA